MRDEAPSVRIKNCLQIIEFSAKDTSKNNAHILKDNQFRDEK
jgi:hypothetical protein